MIVAIPCLPGFAGDIKSDDALGTRAIMEFQYNSINRSKGHSIMEKISAANVDPMEYIRFYNLRNYDRINSSKAMKDVEDKAGVSYDDARRGFDQRFGQVGESEKYGAGHKDPKKNKDAYDRYQAAAAEVHGQQEGKGGKGGKGKKGGQGRPETEAGQEGQGRQKGHGRQGSQGREESQGRQESQGHQDMQSHQAAHSGDGQKTWDSVASCYMLNGEDIRNVPWDGDAQSEIDAFVSEELYIHTKMCIADDRKVICGSANLNDRSQLGSHDSEIAILVEDQDEIDSSMAGKPWRASKFAASLRRQIFRKHLGLLPPQDMEAPDANFMPVGQDKNKYDWGSREDKAVEDPLSPSFMNLWKTTAKTNTEVFRRVFHTIPDDTVKNWKQYDDFYEKYFKPQQVSFFLTKKII